jgi:DNA-binding NtrC family response regulator
MTKNPSVLIVEDEPDTLASLADLLKQKRFQPLTASCLKEAREISAAERVDAILLDEYLPDGSGIDWVPELRLAFPSMAIIVITGGGDIPTAVKAMRQGADDFLTKPIHVDELIVVLERSMELERLKWMDHSRRRLSRKELVFVGESTPAKRMWSLVYKAAQHEAPVLLQGETGVGKGVIARWIHEKSDRQSKSFVELNCSSMGGDLLASELFGHRKGAFTSAIENREGLLDLSNGGTLFLDEIGDMDPTIQAQFLKVIEEKRFRRLGENKSRSSNFRLICATNKNLEQESKEGRFRNDLFFRIHVFPSISSTAMEHLKTYGWPGNIRELRNVLERACLIAEGKPLAPQHFPGISNPPQTGANTPFKEEGWQLESSEGRHIQNTLARFDGNVNRTAQALGISRATLYRKLKKYKFNRKEE